MKLLTALTCVAGLSAGFVVSSAQAALVTTRNEFSIGTAKAADGTQGANEYGPGDNQRYSGSGTSGFGGTVGDPTGLGGTWMAADTSNFYVGFRPASALNDNYVIQFEVNGGGTVTTATHGDGSDGGRRGTTFSAYAGNVSFPIPVTYSLVMGNFGTVLFKYNTANPGGSLDFLQFDGNAWNANGTAGGYHEIAIPWATFGVAASPAQIDWFGYYVADSGYLSNEGTPSAPVAGFGGANPGNGDGSPVIYPNFDRFTTPAPGAAALLGLGGLLAGRRRR
jgi:hypothetical protein